MSDGAAVFLCLGEDDCWVSIYGFPEQAAIECHVLFCPVRPIQAASPSIRFDAVQFCVLSPRQDPAIARVVADKSHLPALGVVDRESSPHNEIAVVLECQERELVRRVVLVVLPLPALERRPFHGVLEDVEGRRHRHLHKAVSVLSACVEVGVDIPVALLFHLSAWDVPEWRSRPLLIQHLAKDWQEWFGSGRDAYRRATYRRKKR